VGCGNIFGAAFRRQFEFPIFAPSQFSPLARFHPFPVFAPKGRGIVATGEAQRNPWAVAEFQFRPEGAEECLTRSRTSQPPEVLPHPFLTSAILDLVPSNFAVPSSRFALGLSNYAFNISDFDSRRKQVIEAA
jgi:hypothetical protein